jgi:hypothetical protein
MKHKAAQQEELDRIDTLTIIEAVAYANRLNIRLRRNGCTNEERKNGLKLLGRLTERVHFLKITLEPVFSVLG